jgi:hypothetical protein
MQVLCADGGLQRPHFADLHVPTVDEVPSRSVFAVVTHPDVLLKEGIAERSKLTEESPP